LQRAARSRSPLSSQTADTHTTPATWRPSGNLVIRMWIWSNLEISPGSEFSVPDPKDPKRLAHLFDSFLHCPIMCSISWQREKEDKGGLPICSTAFTFSWLWLVDLPGNEWRRRKVIGPSVRLPFTFLNSDWLIYQPTSELGEKWLAHLFICRFHFLILIGWFTRQRVEEEKGDWLIYLTDAGQSLHFQCIFACAKKAGENYNLLVFCVSWC
jgi:hypothetical protein